MSRVISRLRFIERASQIRISAGALVAKSSASALTSKINKERKRPPVRSLSVAAFLMLEFATNAFDVAQLATPPARPWSAIAANRMTRQACHVWGLLMRNLVTRDRRGLAKGDARSHLRSDRNKDGIFRFPDLDGWTPQARHQPGLLFVLFPKLLASVAYQRGS